MWRSIAPSMAAKGLSTPKPNTERGVVVTDHARKRFKERVEPTATDSEIIMRFEDSLPAAVRVGRRGQREESHARIHPITATVFAYVNTKDHGRGGVPIHLITSCYPWAPTSSVTIRGIKMCPDCWTLHRPAGGECPYCGSPADEHPEADSCRRGLGRWFDIENNDWGGTNAALSGRINRG